MAGDVFLLMSDVHANYAIVDQQVAHAEALMDRRVEQVVVLGDFGLFGPNLHKYFRRDGQRFQRPVAFLEGNHEDFRAFEQLVVEYEDVVTHWARGSRQDILGQRTLCLGGARYMDAWSTPSGSEITEEDIARAHAIRPGTIDLVLSHDCPSGIGVGHEPGFEHLGEPGVPGFARLAEHLRPRHWIFGHHHRWHEHERDGTRFVGLPQSWQGFVLVDESGSIQCVEHVIQPPRRPRWWRLIGLK